MGERTRVVVLGGTGMLGHTLFELLSARPELDVHATVRDAAALEARATPEQRRSIQSGIDAARFQTIERAIDAVHPAVVINAIGIVKQVPASRDPVASHVINARLPHLLARLCVAAGMRLIHFSTDCVYSGTRGGYTEDDPPDPTDLYGRTKLLGETSEGGALTLRTSLIGHELTTRHGLVEWFLAQEGNANGFRRAIFSGLPTVEVARVLAEVVIPHPQLSGVYHLSSTPISKLELLGLVARRYDKRIELLPLDEPTIDRSLDSSRFRAATGYQAPPWPQLVDGMFEDAAVRYGSGLRTAAGR